MIDLEERYLNEVKRILREHVPVCEVRAFGSRVSGCVWKYSDLGLVLLGDGTIDWRKVERPKDAFSESDLPIVVDVLDWHAVDPEFRRVVLAESEVVQERKALGHTE